MLVNPRLEINISSIRENIRTLNNECNEKNLKIIAVTKSYCANKNIIKSIIKQGISIFADSRMENLFKIRKWYPNSKLMLLRIAMSSEAFQIVNTCDYSANSSLETIKKLNSTAVLLKKKHGIVLMIDMGDLREGILPEYAIEMAQEVEKLNNVFLAGIAVNFACFGGVLPDKKNTSAFGELGISIEKSLGKKLEIISVGGSVCIDIMREGLLHPSITHLRLGESITNGTNASMNSARFHGLRTDGFELIAELVELIEKTSVPIGQIGYDAFGSIPVFENKGKMIRGVIAIGKQDTPFDYIEPLDERIEILGGSSDHMICDFTKCNNDYRVGDEIHFNIKWASMLHLMTSHYVKKVIKK